MNGSTNAIHWGGGESNRKILDKRDFNKPVNQRCKT